MFFLPRWRHFGQNKSCSVGVLQKNRAFSAIFFGAGAISPFSKSIFSPCPDRARALSLIFLGAGAISEFVNSISRSCSHRPLMPFSYFSHLVYVSSNNNIAFFIAREPRIVIFCELYLCHLKARFLRFSTGSAPKIAASATSKFLNGPWPGA